jgi:hypothetical protein
MAKKVKVKIPLYPGVKPVPQFVSVNNYTCMIKPGEEVEVPDFVAEVLKHREEMLVAGAEYAASVSQG